MFYCGSFVHPQDVLLSVTKQRDLNVTKVIASVVIPSRSPRRSMTSSLEHQSKYL